MHFILLLLEVTSLMTLTGHTTDFGTILKAGFSAITLSRTPKSSNCREFAVSGNRERTLGLRFFTSGVHEGKTSSVYGQRTSHTLQHILDSTVERSFFARACKRLWRRQFSPS